MRQGKGKMFAYLIKRSNAINFLPESERENAKMRGKHFFLSVTPNYDLYPRFARPASKCSMAEMIEANLWGNRTVKRVISGRWTMRCITCEIRISRIFSKPQLRISCSFYAQASTLILCEQKINTNTPKVTQKCFLHGEICENRKKWHKVESKTQ